MISPTIALAFTAGMVATFNPCGFSLLPAYLGGFVAVDDVAVSVERRLVRAAGVSVAVSAGFVIVFATVGLIIDQIASETRQQLPWVTIVIGGLLIVLGVAAMAGWRPTLPVPVPRLGTGRGGLGLMVGYGITFAVASLSCTIGPFLAVTGAALNGSAWEASTVYVAYALGMGMVVLILSLGAAFAHSSIASSLRHFSRIAPRIGGLLMVIAGVYAVWYGRWELAVYNGQLGPDPIVDRVETLRLQLVAEVLRFGAAPLILLVGVIAIGVAAWPRVRPVLQMRNAETTSRRRPGSSAATDPFAHDAAAERVAERSTE